jgi:DNA replication and repair protein RecF
LPLGAGGNLFCGPNGAGKTNFVEALALTCTGRPLRANPQRLLVQQGFETAYTGVMVESEELGELRAEVTLPKAGTRSYLLNGQTSSKADFVTTFPVLVFYEEDLETVRGAASRRRSFLNLHLAQTSRSYYNQLSVYSRALAQRNALLRQFDERAALFEPWERQLATTGAMIMEFRMRFLDDLTPLVTRYSELLRVGEPVSLEYRPNVRTKDDLADGILAALRESRELDMRLRFSTSGPHRDDLVLKLAGAPMRHFASAGQQRLFALALKLAAGELLAARRNESPLVVLDEAFAQLDQYRASALVEALSQFDQWLATVALGSLIPEGANAQATRFDVYEGQVKASG